MNEKVKKIIDQAKSDKEKEKADFLISHEIYDKEFAPLKINGKGYVDNEEKKIVSFITDKLDVNIGGTIKVRVNKAIKDAIITELMYVEGDFDDGVYSNMEYDDNYGTYRHYKIIPIEITDEEYEQLVDILDEKENKSSKRIELSFTNIPIILYVIGALIWVAGFISGAVLYDEFGGIGVFVTWILAFISGMSFVSFGKIIDILDEIKNHTIEIRNEIN